MPDWSNAKQLIKEADRDELLRLVKELYYLSADNKNFIDAGVLVDKTNVFKRYEQLNIDLQDRARGIVGGMEIMSGIRSLSC